MTDVDALAAGIEAHRQQVRREWRESHREVPEYSDIIHMCVPECSALILAVMPEHRIVPVAVAEAGEAVLRHPIVRPALDYYIDTIGADDDEDWTEEIGEAIRLKSAIIAALEADR